MSDRFRSLEGILNSPPTRPALRAVDDASVDASDAEGAGGRGPDATTSGARATAPRSRAEAPSEPWQPAESRRAEQEAEPGLEQLHATRPSSTDAAPAVAGSQSPAAARRSSATIRRRTSGSPANAQGTTPRSDHTAAAPASDSTAVETSDQVREDVDFDPVSQTTGGTRRVAFRLAADLHERFAQRVRVEGTSQAHVVLDAVEAAHGAGVLDDLVAAERPSVPSGSLFARRPTRGAATATVPTEIRLDAGSLHILDQLVADTGADSRTQLILAALKQHLG